MDIAHARPNVSNADDDVNVKNSYVNCWERTPVPRALLETPSVPPLARGAERDGGR